MYLVMLETNGNQHYVFSSPCLRENIGAFAQFVCLKEWTGKALNETGANTVWERNAAAHLTSTRVGRISDDDVSDLNFITERTEWVNRTPGKVIFMVKTEICAKAVTDQITRTALAQAPGIDILDVYISMNDQSAVDEDLLKKAHAEAAIYVLRRSLAQARFSQMLFLARVKDPPLPVVPPLSCMLPGGSKDGAVDDLATAHSLPSRIKRYRAYWAHRGLTDLVTNTNAAFKEEKDQDRLAPDPTKFRERLEHVFSIGKEDWPTNASVPRNPDDSASAPADTSEQSVQQEIKPEEDLERVEEVLSVTEYPSQGGRTGKDNRDTHLTAAQRSIISPGPIALSKVATIHIDGNGIGVIMRNLKAAVGCVPLDESGGQLGYEPRDPDALRRFVLTVSLRLDAAVAGVSVIAWYDAARWAQKNRRVEQIDFTAVPIVPAILGGDDVTVTTSGNYALLFATSFLLHLEEKTAADPLLEYLHAVSKIYDKEGTSDPAPMTVAAGVAIVRRNFPLHTAYELAEKLVGRAKGVGKNQDPPCSISDLHVLFDTTVVEPDDQFGGYGKFTTRPFRLVKRTSDSETQTPTDVLSGDPLNASEAPVSATWRDTCRRVARFKGFQHMEDEKDRIELFSRTRATRIRKLLSDGKQEEMVKHQEAAKKEASANSDIAHGGSESLFNLLELADLLLDSYLQQVTGLVQPKDSTPTTPTSEETHS